MFLVRIVLQFGLPNQKICQKNVPITTPIIATNLYTISVRIPVLVHSTLFSSSA